MSLQERLPNGAAAPFGSRWLVFFRDLDDATRYLVCGLAPVDGGGLRLIDDEFEVWTGMEVKHNFLQGTVACLEFPEFKE